MENYLGIDFGKSKIGIAIALEGILASPLSILANDKEFLPKLKKIIEENQIQNIVIGVPLSMDGSQSQSTENALKFVEDMKMNFPSQNIFTYDERLTSKEARKNLQENKALDDAEAARIILQGYLDRQKSTNKNIP